MSSVGRTSMAAVAALGEGLRLRLFDFIRRARRPVSREEAATEVGISRKLAAFHLDKLVEVGLLQAPTGAQGGGRRKVGRTPKLYSAEEVDVQISIPRRDFEVLAAIMVEAMSAGSSRDDAGAHQAAVSSALEHGRQLGQSERVPEAELSGLDPVRALALAERILERHGFEPYRRAPDVLRLANCQFRPLCQRSPDLVCGMNHAYLAGFLSGLGTAALSAHLAPQAPECCVELRPRGAASMTR